MYLNYVGLTGRAGKERLKWPGKSGVSLAYITRYGALCLEKVVSGRWMVGGGRPDGR